LGSCYFEYLETLRTAVVMVQDTKKIQQTSLNINTAGLMLVIMLLDVLI